MVLSSEEGLVTKKMFVGVAALAVVVLVSGCGDNYDAHMRNMLKLSGEISETIESAKDKESAEKAATKLDELHKKLLKLLERGKKIQEKISQEELKRLSDKYSGDMMNASNRIGAATQQLLRNPEAAKILKTRPGEVREDLLGDSEKRPIGKEHAGSQRPTTTVPGAAPGGRGRLPHDGYPVNKRGLVRRSETEPEAAASSRQACCTEQKPANAHGSFFRGWVRDEESDCRRLRAGARLPGQRLR